MGEVQKQKHSFQKKNQNHFSSTPACFHVCLVISSSCFTEQAHILLPTLGYPFRNKNLISVSTSFWHCCMLYVSKSLIMVLNMHQIYMVEKLGILLLPLVKRKLVVMCFTYLSLYLVFVLQYFIFMLHMDNLPDGNVTCEHLSRSYSLVW